MKKNIRNLVTPRGMKRFAAGVFAMVTIIPFVGCRTGKENSQELGLEHSVVDSIIDDSSNPELTKKVNDSSSRESSLGSSSEDANYLSQDDASYYDDVTSDDYIVVVTDGPIVSTNEKVSTTYTTSKVSSNINDNKGKSNSGTSSKKGGGFTPASIDTNDKSSNKSSYEPTNSTTTTVKITTTKVSTTMKPKTTTTTTTTTKATTQETTEEQTTVVSNIPSEYSDEAYFYGGRGEHLYYELVKNCGNVRVSINVGYDSGIIPECKMLIQNWNKNDFTNSDVYPCCFRDYSYEEMQQWEDFVLNWYNIINYFGYTDIDYNDYVSNPNKADFLNNVHARRDDPEALKEYITDQIINGNAHPDVLAQPELLMTTYSYVRDRQIFSETSMLSWGYTSDIYAENLNMIYDNSRVAQK